MNNENDRNLWLHHLVKRYEKPLCQYAYSILHNAETAREVVQDTFLRLCKQSRSKIEPRIPAWLFRVCRNRALDIVRKERHMIALDEQLSEEIPTSDRAPDENAAIRDNMRVLMQQVAALPMNQQEVIRLKFQQQLSYREIAAVARLSESNVGFLLHTGLKTLRHQMQHC
jgi:RNA polymerase sigma-70 factor (ECF subfamily)